MALFPKTPGVYIEEIPRFPSSVAAVPTSVPAFLGFTEKAVINGTAWNFGTQGPTNPVRIESLLEFETIFGGPRPETFMVVLSGTNVDIDADRTTAAPDRFLYYHLQMYFANGGGPCYIIAVGNYSTGLSATPFLTGITRAEQADEITLLAAPDAISLGISPSNDRGAVYDAMLAHCAKMQDRFSLLEVEVYDGGTPSTNTIANDADRFRDETLGANNLSYGAAYYPSFDATLPFSYVDSAVSINATAVNLPTNVSAFAMTTLAVINNGIKQVNTLSGFTFPGSGSILFGSSSVSLAGTSDIDDVIAAINDLAGAIVIATPLTATSITITSVTAGVVVSITPPGGITVTGVAVALAPDKTLYNRITAAINAIPMNLYPAATMAGIYCAVDSSRGVWKAPANVSVTLVDKLNRTVKNSDQEGLNVDATSGKSIDVIRKFDGRGNIVWGARTLDGNSNEWRYVNVRRTFIMIEESCKKATMFSVFEPNDMNTWLRIKGMIGSFCTTMWRDGALAGEKPEQAFFVKVGLGETMTSQDILEGRLIVQIGLAVVRPAEFIILQFEHKLQEA
jgi:uncharacterized protein